MFCICSYSPAKNYCKNEIKMIQYTSCKLSLGGFPYRVRENGVLEKLLINGGKKMQGDVFVSGAKNAAVAIIPAALLSDGICVIDNIPEIEDVNVIAETIRNMGAKVDLSVPGQITIDPSGVRDECPDEGLTKKMRASYYLMGALLGRFGHAVVPPQGGCYIGKRPIDQHLKGFSALGADVKVGSAVEITAPSLKGAEIYLDVASVGATINIMLAAVKAEGLTTIFNCAKEPHVIDVANFLNNMGAKIKGAGTDAIRIMGVKKLHSCNYTLIPDQIETGTWMIIAAATNSDITIRNCIPTHMESLSAKLYEAGYRIDEGEDTLRIIPLNRRPKAVKVKTMAYPGFPTDLQQPFSALLAVAQGTSVITETIFEQRYRHLDELRKMGSDNDYNDRIATITGVEKLCGTNVEALDLRGGAALIVAGLMAEGTTTVTGVHYIDRGYEKIVEKLQNLGADIKRIQ